MHSDQEDEDQLRCNICTECFDDAVRRPKMLKCQHTFCLRCLAQYGLNKECIPCPTCRTPTAIGENGVAALQDNQELQSLVQDAQLLAGAVFYSDDSDDEDPENKRVSDSCLWCTKCLKIANPICLANHETSYLAQGIKNLAKRVESTLEDAKLVLSEHASLFQTHLDSHLMIQEACSSGVAKDLEEQIAFYTQILMSIQAQMDTLCLQINNKDHASLVKILHDTEQETKEIKENSRTMFDQVDLISDLQNSSISVQCPRGKHNNKDPIAITFKIKDLPKDHGILMSYMLNQIVQKKILKCNDPKAEVPTQGPDTNWHKVRGRRQKRSSLAGNSRASSQDSLASLPPRALSADCLTSRSHKLKSSSKFSKNSVQCFFDLTLNGEPLGRVIIQLRPDVAPRMCTNFVALCTGHDGYGYKGSKIFKAQPNDHIIGGDFEKNDGTGGHSIYHKKHLFLADNCGLKDELGAVRMRGMGMDESTGLGLIGSQFHIWVGKRFFRTYPRTLVIGKVVQGIEICQEISRMKSIKSQNGNMVLHDNVVINSCGKL